MQVLPRQRDELDAAGVPLQCISQAGRLRRGDGGIALLLPYPEQRLEAWCAIGPSHGSEAMVWRLQWRFLPAYPLVEVLPKGLSRGGCDRRGQCLSRRVPEDRNRLGERRRHQHPNRPTAQRSEEFAVANEEQSEVHRNR